MSDDRSEVEVTTTLDAEEERVLRALHGRGVPGDFALAQKDEGLPRAVQEELRAMELAAFERAGRLDELRRELAEAEAEEQARDEARARILAHLQTEDGSDGGA